MKKLLILAAFLLAVSTIETKESLNSKRVGHVAKGLGSAGVLATGLGITAAISYGILLPLAKEYKKNGIIDVRSEIKLFLPPAIAFVAYGIFKSAKGTYKNFKKAYKND